ncbi:MAG TPA: hypothetical protein IAA05_01255 [Candidatus Blautia excrementipullorum]|nr:hypothetical protein [Candidatus Blautia excrementipullorum]
MIIDEFTYYIIAKRERIVMDSWTIAPFFFCRAGINNWFMCGKIQLIGRERQHW